MKADLVIANVINQRDVNAVKWTEQVSNRISVGKYIEEQKKDRSDEIEALIEESSCDRLSVKTIFKIGAPFHELLQIIQDEKPALVVMGTKGRSNITNTLFGSTAEKMFRRCPVPLLSIRDQIKR